MQKTEDEKNVTNCVEHKAFFILYYHFTDFIINKTPASMYLNVKMLLKKQHCSNNMHNCYYEAFRYILRYIIYYMKSIRVWSFSWAYFPAFGPNTERNSVFLRIQSKCGKIHTIKTPNTDTFHAVFRIL